ncbi:MAG: fibro-slime domain-containing protein [Phycisphaerales bacterium]|nr:fibro-slime domain-containing protein [Phycisphaerales bacterium]MCI0629830.1 fibro-slime domain-containing protein [Phycisphaerales bacterium]MCI0675849.1 fibro-slime domain-containing protein [Phycisphaerales bacterium]
MRSNRITTLTTITLLAVAGTAPFLMPDGIIAQAQGSPNTFPLKGVLRDFRRTNTNFNVVPSGGNGHYAGNVMEDLSSSGRPLYEGDGFKVASQWQDNEAHPIAPHMYIDPDNALSTKVRVSTVPSAPKMGVVDTYDSTMGAYGGANIGPAPEYEVGAMPDVIVPAALSNMPNQGDLNYSGVTTITSDIHCNKLNASGMLEIDGQISILCEGPMMLETHTIIIMKPGSNLKVYLMNGGASWNHTMIGDPAKPGRVKIFSMSDAMFMIHNHAEVYAHITCPNASMELSNHGTLFGRFVGKAIAYRNHGNFHFDMAGAVAEICGVPAADVKGTQGVNSNGGLVSAARFADWYQDVPGTNLSMPFTVTLLKNGSGVWEFTSNAFFPLDNKLFGNQGQSHNFYFTYAATCEFTHHACTDTFFQFEGADDTWLFIDGKLVMDRGGVIPATAQYVDIDRLELNDGEVYQLHFFYAQRNASVSQFKLKTNLDLIENDNPMQFSMGAD